MIMANKIRAPCVALLAFAVVSSLAEVIPLTKDDSFDDTFPEYTTESATETIVAGDFKSYGFELKDVTYTSLSTNGASAKTIPTTTSKVLMIESSTGALRAMQQGYLSADEYTAEASEFADNLNVNEFELLIIDYEVAALADGGAAETLVESKGMTEMKGFVDADDNHMRRRRRLLLGSWKHRTKSWSKNINEQIKRNKTWAADDGTWIDVSIDLTAQVTGKAVLSYKYKKFLGIPYKIRIKYVNARADYSITGHAKVTGQAKVTVPGLTWNIAEPTIASGWFFVGILPVQYDIKLPIKAGTGDLTVKVTGEVGLDKPIAIVGHYEYQCGPNNCNKVSSALTDNSNSLSWDNVAYNLMATVSIEPWAEAAVKARLYWGLIWAKVGLKAGVPIALTGYLGNMCSDADGNGSNEQVSAGLIDIDFRIGIVVAVKYFYSEHYFEIWRVNVYFTDLLNPSTALSPVVRHTGTNGYLVNIFVDLRSCVEETVDKDYQDFALVWGDGSTTYISNIDKSGKTVSHTYSGAGTKNIIARHNTGAYTTLSINLATATPSPTPPPTRAPTFPSHIWCDDYHIQDINMRVATGSPLTIQEIECYELGPNGEMP